MYLSDGDRARVDACVAAFEARTGTQAVTAVVGKSDHYPEIPWKAFALGASATALARLLQDLLHPDWLTAGGTLLDAVLVLGVGAALALATLRAHAFARLFLNAHRAEAETLQHAQVLFLRHEAFATPRRDAVLILVSLFERRVVILPDTGLRARIDDAALRPVLARMTPLLAAGKVGDALCEGLNGVGELIGAGAGTGSGLPDATIEERGDDARA